MRKYWLLGLVVVALVAVAFLFTGKKPTPQNSAGQAPQPAAETNNADTTQPAETNTSVEINTSTSTTQPLDLSKYNTPIMIIDQKKTYTAKVKTTAGEIDIALNAAATPITANNFVFLAKKNFYDNTIFHRVIKGFMIQGGDPRGDGTGGPGYKFDDEPFNAEYTRGTIAMANSGPNTNGSQFFIMHADYSLPKNYVIFGKVIKGLDVVDKIAAAPVTASESGEDSKPVNPVKVVSVEIVEK